VELFGDTVVVNLPDPLRNIDERNDELTVATDTGIGGGEQGEYRGSGAIGDNPRVLINRSLDVDLFRMSLMKGDVVTFDVDIVGFSVWNPAMRLFDGNGNQLEASDNEPAPGEPADTFEPYLELTAPASGVYYIGVSASDNLAYDPSEEESGSISIPSTGPYTIDIQVNAPFDRIDVDVHDDRGDSNIFRDQGQIIVKSNRIMHSAEYGIVSNAAPRDGVAQVPHAGPVRNLQELNINRLVPGAFIADNIIAGSLEGGIRISGDPDPAGLPLAAVPFARVVNNTIYGRAFDKTFLNELNVPTTEETGLGDVGILVELNASPTLLNNILAKLETGINVDASSGTTVLGGTLFQDNLTNANVDLGDFPILLRKGDPLFVNPDFGNFYLQAGSRAIDSSIDSLEDRPTLVTVKDSIGAPVSPILVPDVDVDGQLRVDDPSIEPPTGVGENVFKDRGALDRADFLGPNAVLLTPRDNDGDGIDVDPRQTRVVIFGTLPRFTIQLADGNDTSSPLDGTGADDTKVTSDTVTVTQDGAVLQEGVDYTFDYETTNDIIRLTPLAGLWQADHTYVITLDNSPNSGIADKANNRLNPNQPAGETRFTIDLLQSVDYGDAPDPSYPTLATNGASHVISSTLFLGNSVDAETDGQPTSGADGDGNDEDGVIFGSMLVPGTNSPLTVMASRAGLLDAWIDYNGDGDWNDADEQFAVSHLLRSGDNSMSIPVPSTAKAGSTFARFRFSSAGGLSPTGRADDGEVEDYMVSIIANPWQNPGDSLDVSGGGGVTPLDVLLIINDLNNPVIRDPETGQLPIPPNTSDVPPPFLDVNGDGFVSPLDALLVINHLNSSIAVAPSFNALRPAESAVDVVVSSTVVDSAVVQPEMRQEILSPSVTSIDVSLASGGDSDSKADFVRIDDNPLSDKTTEQAPTVDSAAEPSAVLRLGQRSLSRRDWAALRRNGAVLDETLNDIAADVESQRGEDVRDEVFAGLIA
jgi:hypothetical protein